MKCANYFLNLLQNIVLFSDQSAGFDEDVGQVGEVIVFGGSAADERDALPCYSERFVHIFETDARRLPSKKKGKKQINYAVSGHPVMNNHWTYEWPDGWGMMRAHDDGLTSY